MADDTPNAALGFAQHMPSPVECELVDEHGQAHLLIDDGHSAGAHPLILRMTNRSGHDLEWLAEGDQRCHTVAAHDVFHHLRLRFRPGVLSRAAQTKLRDHPTSNLLGPDATQWRFESVVDEADNFVLHLAFIGNDRAFPADSTRALTLLGLSARGSTSRLTRIGVEFAQIGEKNSAAVSALFPSRRHCHVYLLHGGRRDPPLRLGFNGPAVIRADGESDELTVVLHNPSGNAVGKVEASAVPAQLRLTIENDDASEWGLWHGKREAHKPAPPVARVLLRPDGDRPLTQDQGDTLSWPYDLPQDGIDAHTSLLVKLTGLRAFKEGTTNVYVDLRDIPGFADSRTVLTITRSLASVELAKLNTKIDKLARDLEKLASGAKASDFRAGAMMRMFDPMVPFADRIPLPAWPATTPAKEPIQRQWSEIPTIKALDVSTNYVLGKDGRVYLFRDGRVGEPVTPIPLPTTAGPPLHIGEFREQPVVLCPRSNQAFWLDGQSWLPIITNNPAAHISDVGEGWVVLTVGNIEAPAWLQFERDQELVARARFDGLGRLGNGTIQAIGGSHKDPLLVVKSSFDGMTKVLRRQADWLANGRWEPALSGPPQMNVLDASASGVIVTTDQGIFNFSEASGGGQWYSLGGSARRVGGSHLNPLVVGGGDRTTLYCLKNP
jgi:hypothetical protein